ncbi:MAG: glyoxalase [Planctomycetota bacterium]|nr:glyoxalase [Planctomycetota bacterium]
MNPFHLALTVHDLAAAETFYAGRLGCKEGRRAATWIDYDLDGHQLSLHLDPDKRVERFLNPVDGKQVPLPHFGVVLPIGEWRALAARLEGLGTEFVIRPYLRFEGEVGEQGTMFLYDPSGNALEFKGFRDPAAELFARE